MLDKKAILGKLFFIGLFFIQCSILIAQRQLNTDSLKQLIATLPNDTNKIYNLILLGECLYKDSADFFYNKSFKLSKEIHKEKYLAELLSGWAEMHYEQKGFKFALEHYKKVLKIYEEIEDKEGIAYALISMGEICQIQGNIEKTIEYYVKSLKIAEEIRDKEGVTYVLSKLGYIYHEQGNIPKTLEYFNKSLKVFQEIGDKEGIAGSLNNLGYIYYDQGDIPKAMEYHNKSLKIYEEIGNKKGIADPLNNLGGIYHDQGNFQKAIEYYNKSLKISEESGDKEDIANSLNNLGTIYENQGNIPKSIEYFNNSLKIYEEIVDKEGIATSLGNLGTICEDQGNIPKAIEYLSKSIIISEEIGDKVGIAGSLNNLGNIYHDQGDIPKSIEFHNKSLKIREEIGNKAGIAESLNNLGTLYGDTVQMEYCNKSLKIFEEIGNKSGIAVSLNNLGNIYYNQGNTIKAIEYYSKSLKINKEIGDEKGIANCLNNHGYIYKLLGHEAFIKENHELASMYYKKADTMSQEFIRINSKSIISNFGVLSEKSQELYFKTIEENYMDFNSYVLYRKADNPDLIDNVFNNTIKNKGLLLKSSTAMRNAVLSSKDTVLINQYQKWIALKQQIVKLSAIPKDERGQSLEELEEQANNVEAELVKSSTEFSDFKKLQNMSWLDVQKSLKPDEAAVEFVHFKFKNYKAHNYFKFSDTILYCALIIKPNSTHPEMILLFNEKKLEYALGEPVGNSDRYINWLYGKNDKAKTALYDLIWKPMEGSLKDVKTVYLSPTGLLHKVSFAAMAIKQNVYLCDAYNIQVKTSTGQIIKKENRVQNQSIPSATIFGGIIYDTDSTKNSIWPYLIGTKKEAENISKIFKSESIKVDYFSNKTATEEAFKLTASQSSIIHIATHGFFYPDPKEIQKEEKENTQNKELNSRGGRSGFGLWSFVKNPNPLMRSGLVFAGANDVWSKDEQDDRDDGVLTAQEVAQIDMRKTELVVMSACETGLGDIKGSEGVYGLQRAFKMSGVDYMIMSLWKVPDQETQEFMTMFYEKLLKQNDIKQAFADTQKEMRTKYDPYYWAAFVLIE